MPKKNTPMDVGSSAEPLNSLCVLFSYSFLVCFRSTIFLHLLYFSTTILYFIFHFNNNHFYNLIRQICFISLQQFYISSFISAIIIFII